MKKGQKTFCLILCILIVIGSWSVMFLQHLRASPLPLFGSVSKFSLTDSTGKEFTLTDLKGKITVVDFIFTTCSGVCPVMTRNMSLLNREFNKINDVRFVSVSVNPEFDTPEVLAKYAHLYRADPLKWYFLMGSRKAIQDLAVHGFKIGSIEEPVFHSSYFVLVDRRARIRGYYDGTEKETIEKIRHDILLLLRKK